jgi:tetratricopeptide (TPR) repeat protein
VLKKIQSERPLSEPDVNYLKKRKLDKTLKLIHRKKADQLIENIENELGLSVEDIEWCNKFDFPEIPFLALKYEYQVTDRKDNPGEQLHSIFLKFKAEQRLTDDDVVWLDAEELLRPHTKLFIAHHRLLALHCEQEYKRTKGFWNIVNASAHRRKADQPTTAVKLTNNLKHIQALKEAKLKSALFTTRGGALRDLNELKEAENCALEAIDHFSQSHNPYTLMGALCYDTGRYEEGDEWFEKAIKRGAKPNDQESEIRRILNRKKGKERQEIIDHLLKKDPVRFAWVRQYAKNSNKH